MIHFFSEFTNFYYFYCFSHVAALAKLENFHINVKAYNLGTGRGVSVMELIKTFERTNNVQVPFVVEKRRHGDISTMYADP